MRNTFLGAVMVMVLATVPVQVVNAQNVPPFIKQTFPPQAVMAANEERMAVMDPNGALDAKTKHLIALGVAAQIPCDYCVYYHTRAAKHDGATEAQIREAVAAAALTRKWSTMLNGAQYDMSKLKNEVNASFAGD